MTDLILLLQAVYEVQPKRIVVGAIMDLRQDPETIRQKLLGD